MLSRFILVGICVNVSVPLWTNIVPQMDEAHLSPQWLRCTWAVSTLAAIDSAAVNSRVHADLGRYLVVELPAILTDCVPKQLVP